MFNTISWTEFLTIISALIGVYYLITALLFYKSEITAVFNRTSGTTKKQIEAPVLQPDTLLGMPKQDTPVELDRVDAVEITIIHEEVDPEIIPLAAQSNHSISKEEKENPLLISSVSDLVLECRTLIGLIVEHQTNKEATASLFNTLFSRYTHVIGTFYQGEINEFIQAEGSNRFAFTIQPQDVQNFWSGI